MSPPGDAFDAKAFFERLAPAEQCLTLFDHLPRAYLFVKDHRSRFVKVNPAFLSLHGIERASSVIGRTDFDFHPPAMAAQYVEEDRRVMDLGVPLPDQVWLVMGHGRFPHWFVSTKLPLRDRSGRSCGIAGVMRPYDHAGVAPAEYQRLTAAMEFVHTHFREKIAVEELAACAHLSVSQLQREFRRLFAMTPLEYVTRVRLMMARRQLEVTADPVGTIALDCGFYDQSHFTKIFRERTGLAPLAYRRRFSKTAFPQQA